MAGKSLLLVIIVVLTLYIMQIYEKDSYPSLPMTIKVTEGPIIL